jgi:hypothetical protein
MSYLLYRAKRVIPGQAMGELALHPLQMNHPLTRIVLQYDGVIAVSLEVDWTHLTIWTGPLAESVKLGGVQSTVQIIDGQDGWIHPVKHPRTGDPFKHI